MILDASKGDLAEVWIDGFNISVRVCSLDDGVDTENVLLSCEVRDYQGRRIIEDGVIKEEQVAVPRDLLFLRNIKRADADAFAGERASGRPTP